MDPEEFIRETRAVAMPEVSPAKLKTLSTAEKVTLGRRILKNSMISPAAGVSALISVLLDGVKHLFDAEKMEFYEKIVIQSLGAGDKKLANKYIALLERRFGQKSNRVRLLKGLFFEANGEEAEAEKLYAEILRADPSNCKAVQRRAAIQAGKGNLSDAVRILEYDRVYSSDNNEKFKFSEIHPADQGTLLQLSKWYYELNDYEKAIYYIDECILFGADNYVYHLRAGELNFQQKKWSKSIAHYSHSLLLNDTPNNCRGALGLHQAIKHAIATKEGNPIENEHPWETLIELYESVCLKIRKMYSKSPLLSYIEIYLNESAL